MELYVLDSLFRREKVVDYFQSLIWTERLNTFGDFELVLPATNAALTTFDTGTRVALNESYRVMTIETREIKVNDDGESMLTIKGRSLETILSDRVAMGFVLPTDPIQIDGKWVLSGTPSEIARRIFDDVCRNGAMDVKDIIPYLSVGSLYPADLIAEPPDVIVREIEPQTVYDAIVKLCTDYGLGMRLVKHPTTTTLYFDVYMGSYRTADQSVLPAVIFSPELENLQNTTELKTSADFKNVAYVIAATGDAVMVYSPSADPDDSGFDRRVLLVNASDITAETADIPAAMVQKGLEELSKHTVYQAFDGEVGQDGSYQYGVDFNLGDVVEVRASDGAMNQMRVVEQIFVSDDQGDRSYPTLSLNLFVGAGTWLAQSTREWVDFGIDEYWADQP